jgi:hypothetical protein
VDHRRSLSSLPALYDAFLFAPVCEDRNGMRVSVLSALARTDVDPWEEAGRLATMPRAAAARLLASSLDLVFDKARIPAGAGAIAARLVRLLPQGADAPADPGANDARPVIQQVKAGVQLKNYWWIWVGFAIAVTIMSPHHQTSPAAPGIATSQPGAATVHDDGGVPMSAAKPIAVPAR